MQSSGSPLAILTVTNLWWARRCVNQKNRPPPPCPLSNDLAFFFTPQDPRGGDLKCPRLEGGRVPQTWASKPRIANRRLKMGENAGFEGFPFEPLKKSTKPIFWQKRQSSRRTGFFFAILLWRGLPTCGPLDGKGSKQARQRQRWGRWHISVLMVPWSEMNGGTGILSALFNSTKPVKFRQMRITAPIYELSGRVCSPGLGFLWVLIQSLRHLPTPMKREIN